ncbi:MAG: ubiquinol-cytochrome c reductase iron-sulfur subunit [Acidobacteria bacterium]|nr:ubiquinol-cytochrome c reductase iron-sulfur subunit [Acidobacteriota bacterium]
MAGSESTNCPVSDELDVRRATDSYQAEFPYNRDAESEVTRREFCNFLVLASGTFFVGAVGFSAVSAYDASRERVFTPAAIEGAENLTPGSAMNFSYPRPEDTAILIRTSSGDFRAYGQKCTHLSCPVYYSKEHKRLECPCHEGGFSEATGEVLYGPPPRPLDKIDVELRGGKVVAFNREVRGNEV